LSKRPIQPGLASEEEYVLPKEADIVETVKKVLG
jgi:hypothetical protein